MRCFFCLEDRPPSDEHVFALAIGGNYVTRRVCKPCNDLLGREVDARLVNHPLIAFRRSQLSLAGNSGKVPDAVVTLLGHGVLAAEPEQRIRIVRNAGNDMYEARVLYRETRHDLPDGGQQVHVVLDAGEGVAGVRKVIRRIRQREGLPPLSDDELDRLASEAVANIQTIEHPEVRVGLRLPLDGYPRALLKIAYELACTWLGDTYLGDPMAEVIRDAVLGRMGMEGSGVKGRTLLGLKGSALLPWAAHPDSHIAFTSTVQGCILVSLKVFDTFSASFVVSERAALYGMDTDNPDLHRFLRIDTRTRGKEETTLAEAFLELLRAGSQFPLDESDGVAST